MMTITLVCGVLMAIFLFRHRNKQPNTASLLRQSLLPLAGYNLAMGLWCAGHLSITLGLNNIGLKLVAINPLLPTLFLHFVVIFIELAVSSDRSSQKLIAVITGIKRYMPHIYGCSVISMIVNNLFGQSSVEPWLDFPGFVVFDHLSWYSLAYTIVIGLCAHGLLLWSYLVSKGSNKATKTIILLFIAAAWGFLTASSYVLPSLNINVYPYLMWLIPTYIVFMTFAVLRYQWFFVNRLAIKTIIWTGASIAILLLITLLTSITSQFGIGFKGLNTVELEIIWLYSLISGSTLWLLYKPLNKLATQLVYPGINLNQSIIDTWIESLSQSRDYTELADTASKLISKHLRQKVMVIISPNDTRLENDVSQDNRACQIHCYLNQDIWQFELHHWQDVSPTLRHVGEVFAPLVFSSCVALEKSLVLANILAKEEKDRQQQIRLAELGGLSAALAHELRNPLNIISMASATTDKDTKTHIQQQLKRADTLISDLLDYAKVIELRLQLITLKPLLEALIANATSVHDCQFSLDCDDNCQIFADIHKLQQVVINCLDNAGAFAATVTNGKVHIQVKAQDALELAFHNNGPAISEAIKPQLFKPFISKRPGGSGLGLAIVQRIMEAHQGRVYYSQSADWPVSFICIFPKADNKEMDLEINHEQS